jgi:hypothetical protein
MARTFHDLPTFVVTAIRDGESKSSGYTRYDLAGVSNSLRGVRLGRCWLLLPNLDGLIGDWEALDHETRHAAFSTSERTPPCDIGASLAFVNGCWDAHRIKMVVQPEWNCQKIVFSLRTRWPVGTKMSNQLNPPKKKAPHGERFPQRKSESSIPC